MHHGPTVDSVVGGGFPWLIVGLIALAALVGLVVWLLARGQEDDDWERSPSGEIEENLDGQIMAMLHQAGGTLLQTEIAANLDVSTECVACALRDLQDAGRVTREWKAGEYTYRVTHHHGRV